MQAVTAGTTALPTFTMSLPTVHVDVIPNAPSDVTTTVVSYNEIDLSWTSNSDSAQTYNILRSDDGGVTYNSIGTTDGSETSYQDASVQPQSSYLYEVEADDSAGLSSGPVPPADSTADTTPGAPVPTLNVTVINLTATAILTWSYTGPVAASGYELEEEDISLGQNFYWIPLTAAVQLTPGDQYYFRLRADLADGTVSPYTGEQQAFVPNDPNVTLSASAYGTYDPDFPGGGNPNGPSAQIQLTLEDSSGTPLDDQPFFYRYFATSTAGPGWVDGTDAPDGGPDFTDADGHYYVGVGLGQTGTFEVQLDVSGPAQWSSPASATEPGPEFTGPSGFTATATSDTTMLVSWAGDTSDTGFDEYALGLGGYAPGSRGTAVDMYYERYWDYTPGQSTITETVGGMTPGSTCDVMLEAITVDHATGQAHETWQHATVRMTGNVAPAAPSSLSAVYDPTAFNPRDANKVSIHWINTPNNESGFVLSRSINGSSYVQIATTAADVTTFTDTLSGLPRLLTAGGYSIL